MGKSTFFTGQPIFNQLLSLIPRIEFAELSRKHQADRYCKRFSSYAHLITLLYSTLHKCSSLREVATGMQACGQRLRHLGLNYTPRRSTLADANARRPAALFEELYHLLYRRHYGCLPDSLHGRKIIDKLFMIDSTVITLFSSAIQGTGDRPANGKRKGGVKAHVLLAAKENIPCFVSITEGKKADHTFLPQVTLPAGSIVVIDKGYRSYEQFSKWTQQKISWVTRLHSACVYEKRQQCPLSENQIRKGVKADFEILLGSPKAAYIHPLQKARLVLFTDPISGNCFEFITNNFTYSAATIAEIYKKRWQIELVFKRIKQNFQLHFFLGDNENAIKIQLWCTFIADLLIKIVKDKVAPKRKWSMSNLAALVRLHLGTYINLYAFLAQPDKALMNYSESAHRLQLSIFPKSIRGA